MQQTVRSYLTAGVAVVGAGALALAPIQAVDSTLSDTRIPAVFSGPVGLTAISNPTYEEVFTRASENFEALVSYFFEQYDNDATPIQVIIQNQTANLETIAEAARNTVDAVGTALTETVPNQIRDAIDALGEGDFYSAVNLLVGAAIAPVAPLIFLAQPIQAALTQTLTNAVNAFTFVTDPLTLGIQLLSVVGPVINAAAAAVASVQAIVDSFDGGDPLREIVNAPATILNGFLSGGYGPDFGAVLGGGALPFGIFAGGLLTGPELINPAAGPEFGFSLAGPIGALLLWRAGLADSIRTIFGFGRAAAESQVSDLPDADANFISISTDELTDEPPVKEVSYQESAPEPEKIGAAVTDPDDEVDVDSEPTDSEPVDGTDDGTDDVDLAGDTDEGDDSDLEESVDVTGGDEDAGDEDGGENDGADANDGGSDNGGTAGDNTSDNGSEGDSSSSNDKGSDGADE
ncbi:hypothetical protein [Mycolicibacterium monacense]|uniref:PE-PGRS family protein n=1 Tax=Mycolicibacterium monacense TaxID=85693 RepID=A0AAD1ISK1_MYCMB|nr:hypothetical protein [Mycolicibacterium monacense]MDA4101641.1 hypothetical protein [Mycolicibacterium monacense DSM 44395]ORB24707.1 hypothetical protein BST34_01740 [Mycolicibacterium monacense DSM 44395]QHP87184.1 hypothetical protein EWR22_18480 [Mycolicibacterium monacense DSM 44395]BBZ59714.1 hypothetical protein MMON_10150 [Mycolicibacterium monacense]